MTKRPDQLHYYRCNRICKAVTAKSVYSGRYERCRGCGSMALYVFSVPVETDEQRAIFDQGVVFNPGFQKPLPWRCVRCGKEQTRGLPEYRADGKVCLACYQAEESPQAEPYDPDLTAAEREDSNRMEQAYQQLETKGQRR